MSIYLLLLFAFTVLPLILYRFEGSIDDVPERGRICSLQECFCHRKN